MMICRTITWSLLTVVSVTATDTASSVISPGAALKHSFTTPAAVGIIESRPCRQNSSRRECLQMVTYRNGRTQYRRSVCAQGCVELGEYKGVAWSAFGGLSEGTRADLIAKYARLVRLVRAAPGHQFGGDEQRLSLRVEIITAIARQMLPLALRIATNASASADPSAYIHEAEAQPTAEAARGFRFDGSALHTYEAAVIDGTGESAGVRNPDETAAELLGELHRMGQQSSRSVPSSVIDLSLTSKNSFYRVVLRNVRFR